MKIYSSQHILIKQRFSNSRAVYCILGGCDVEDDHAEVAHRLDDYLWLKLSVVRHNSDGQYTSDFITYSAFQSLIYETYGNPHGYFLKIVCINTCESD